MKNKLKLTETDLVDMINKIVKEQSLPRHIKKGSKEHADWVRSQQGDNTSRVDLDDLLEELLIGAQRLTKFVEDTKDRGMSRDDLRDIQKDIEYNIIEFIKTTEER
jgi:hypothetical protein|tara:strand:+ start:2536 stop:2853 length:318 start_codon:yes stop_codon:yes gene_type:complete